MRERGFPAKYVLWIELLLTSSTSSILLNGIPGQPIRHQRGVRQGDPISPYLFILAADVLSSMLRAACTTTQSGLTERLPQPYYLFQYADDALIFSTVEGQAVQRLKMTLNYFSEVSGLQISFAKSSFVPLNLELPTIQRIRAILDCQLAELPLTYLGLPLTSKKPERSAFQPLLEKLERRLATWKSKLITRAGRLQLISSVLSSIPTYHLSCFCLPRWLLNKIESLSRRFLWSSTTGGIPLKNWQSVCLPKAFGGLGIKDLSLQNRVLLLRWWWRLYSDPDSLWSQFMAAIYSRRIGPSPPINWLPTGSFFWKELFKLRLMFQLSSSWDLADGNSPSFWYDAWSGQPLSFLAGSKEKPPKSNLTLASAATQLEVLLPAPLDWRSNSIVERFSNITLTQGHDRILWKWSSNLLFSSKKTYDGFISIGKIAIGYDWIWKLKVPPKVKLFSILLLQGKLLTQKVLLKRNFQVQIGCALCDSVLVEDDLHLFLQCPFSASLWRLLQSCTGLPAPTVRDTVLDTIMLSFETLNGPNKRRLLGFLVTGLWMLWGERNNRIFRGDSRSVQVLARCISQDGALFFKHV